jgi:hypothetical protein
MVANKLPIHQNLVVAEEHNVRIFKGLMQFPEIRLFHIIVTVQKGNIRSPGMIQTDISCAGRPAIFLAYMELKAGIFLRKFPANGTGRIHRSIFHQVDLEVFVGLGAQGIKAFIQSLFRIVYGHNYAESGHSKISLSFQNIQRKFYPGLQPEFAAENHIPEVAFQNIAKLLILLRKRLSILFIHGADHHIDPLKIKIERVFPKLRVMLFHELIIAAPCLFFIHLFQGE